MQAPCISWIRAVTLAGLYSMGSSASRVSGRGRRVARIPSTRWRIRERSPARRAPGSRHPRRRGIGARGRRPWPASIRGLPSTGSRSPGRSTDKRPGSNAYQPSSPYMRGVSNFPFDGLALRVITSACLPEVETAVVPRQEIGIHESDERPVNPVAILQQPGLRHLDGERPAIGSPYHFPSLAPPILPSRPILLGMTPPLASIRAAQASTYSSNHRRYFPS